MTAAPARLLIPALVLLCLGCSTARTERFDIELRNATSKPLTLSLAKEGPASPFEPAWATPQDVALESPAANEQFVDPEIGRGRMLMPGEVWTQRVSGKFASGARAFVRAYAGDVSISQMLSRGQGSPGRVDIPLSPGPNRAVVEEKLGRIVAHPE